MVQTPRLGQLQLSVCAAAEGLELFAEGVRWSGRMSAEDESPCLRWELSGSGASAQFARDLEEGRPSAVGEAVSRWAMPSGMLDALAKRCVERGAAACQRLLSQSEGVDRRWRRALSGQLPGPKGKRTRSKPAWLNPGLLVDGLDVLVNDQSLPGSPLEPSAEVLGGAVVTFLRCQLPALKLAEESTVFVVGNGRGKSGLALAEVGRGCQLVLVDHVPERFTRFSLAKDAQVLPPPGWLLESMGEGAFRLVRADDRRLFASVREGNAATAARLLETGLDPNARDRMGYTPLFWASQLGHLLVVQLLLEAGAEVNATGNNGLTALLLAATFCQAEVSKALLAAGAGPRVVNQQGEQAIHLSAARENPAVLEVLLLAGVPPDERTHTGWTPLMMAAREGHIACVQALVAAGADLEARNGEGRDALFLAREKERADVVAFLEQVVQSRQGTSVRRLSHSGGRLH